MQLAATNEQYKFLEAQKAKELKKQHEKERKKNKHGVLCCMCFVALLL